MMSVEPRAHNAYRTISYSGNLIEDCKAAMANEVPQPKEKGMLILTRKPGESLIIGGNVTVTVLGVQGKQTRIGISAPRDVDIHREEIYERIQETGNQKEPAATE